MNLPPADQDRHLKHDGSTAPAAHWIALATHSKRNGELDGRSRLEELAFVHHFRVGELAQALGVSARHLQRLFKTHLECTPQRWLMAQRMKAAHRLLASASSVKEVALTLGFRHESQFSRDFRVHFGLSPSQLLGRSTTITARSRRESAAKYDFP